MRESHKRAQPGAPRESGRSLLREAHLPPVRQRSGVESDGGMAGIPAVDTRVPMKLKVPDGTEPPLGLDAWRALPGAERTAIRDCYEQNVHVRVQGSGLHAACPSLPYVIDNDVAYLPLHIVESFYVRLMRLAPGVRHDLTVMVDPAALAEVERIALEKGLDASPTTPTVYLQRLQALSLHLRDAVFPTADRDDDAVKPRMP